MWLVVVVLLAVVVPRVAVEGQQPLAQASRFSVVIGAPFSSLSIPDGMSAALAVESARMRGGVLAELSLAAIRHDGKTGAVGGAGIRKTLVLDGIGLFGAAGPGLLAVNDRRIMEAILELGVERRMGSRKVFFSFREYVSAGVGVFGLGTRF